MAAVGVNGAQAKHWNGPEGEHWAAHHDRYAAMLGPFGAPLLDAVRLASGESVLDVGCGAGDLTLAAAHAVGSTGRVVGVDLSEPMLARAAARARAAGLDNVALVAADAQTHDFAEGEFDVAVSRLGVMFFEDSDTAFTNIARSLRPGGRLGFVCWQDAGPNEWMLVPSMAALAHVPPPDPAVFEMLSPFELADPNRVTEILQGAGLTGITIEGIERPLIFGGGGSVADAVEFFRDGSFGTTLLAGATPEQTDRALAAVAEAFEAHLTPEGVALGAAAWLVTATMSFACPLS